MKGFFVDCCPEAKFGREIFLFFVTLERGGAGGSS